ncbi:hypothetical protein GK047_24940 [Paenibacillus sp. SYP-B3998]|uniref:Uncharacterized protein n=1 Tax=Paenibacillus sp. SYP-B3998 TaxID=2678564 RepID=A0A6G4A5K3_9BACL|nr:hypothetical protein [Paenibacillus sp. SYP-B3998]NEW09224.1 hypothetical protein [Paenibacillus sp. SYP-B3998]
MSPERKELIDEFFAMIRRLNRTGTDIIQVRDFFWEVSAIRNIVPPTVEFMSVLRTYNAVLFHEFKKSLVPNTSMHLLAGVYMEAGEALISLGITSVEELQLAIKGSVQPPKADTCSKI